MKIVAVLVTALALTACNTVSGLGRDIQGSAEWTKNKMGPSVSLDPSNTK
jgi:predicted small secreted protein